MQPTGARRKIRCRPDRYTVRSADPSATARQIDGVVTFVPGFTAASPRFGRGERGATGTVAGRSRPGGCDDPSRFSIPDLEACGTGAGRVASLGVDFGASRSAPGDLTPTNGGRRRGRERSTAQLTRFPLRCDTIVPLRQLTVGGHHNSQPARRLFTRAYANRISTSAGTRAQFPLIATLMTPAIPDLGRGHRSEANSAVVAASR